MKLSQLEYKKIVLVGYGVENQAAHQFLKQYCVGCTFEIIYVSGDAEAQRIQESGDIAIRSPGVPIRDIVIPHTTAVNIFFANLHPVHQTVGVTGTKGKSTTASLIAHILKSMRKSVVLSGNIGIPILRDPNFLRADEPMIYVLELSSYQLEDCQFSPNRAVITSLFPDHIPHHGSLSDYYAAKKNIILHQTSRDSWYIPPQYARLLDSKAEQASACHQISPDHHVETLLPGEHNQQNIALASAVIRDMFPGAAGEIDQAVRTFHPLPHRLQDLGAHKGIRFVDDAISTTPESTIAAICATSAVSTILLGGEDRGYDFDELARVILTHRINHVILFPASGARIQQAIVRAQHHEGSSLPDFFPAQTMKEAVKYAYEVTPPDTTCLLSCASPSYSLWKNFEEKGDQFHQWVQFFASS